MPITSFYLVLHIVFAGAAIARGISFDFAGGTSIGRQGDQLVVRKKSETGDIDETRLSLAKVEPGQIFFHWGPTERVQNSIAVGSLTPQDVAYYTTVLDDPAKQLYGVGFYMSTDKIDSAAYGDQVLQGEAQEAFWALQAPLSAKDTAEARRDIEELRKVGVRGTKVKETWFTLFDSEVVRGFKAVAPSELAEEALSKLSLDPISDNSLAIRLALKVAARLEAPTPELIAAAERLTTAQNVTIADAAKSSVATMKSKARGAPRD